MIRDKINGALREAVKDGDATRIATLRLVLTALRDRQYGRNRNLEEPDAAQEDATLREILATMVRQRRMQAVAYEEAGRLDLAAHEDAERQILEAFLPRPLGPKEIERAVERAIWESGATGQRDLSRVMALLRARHEGAMDFRAIGKRVMALLRTREGW